jgi:DNA-binding transcriptional LysR family regulator
MLLALPSTHPATRHRSFTAESLLSLAGDNWVTGSTPGDTLDDLVRETFQAAGHQVNVAIRTDDYSVVLGLVAAGMAVALVPSLIGSDLPDGVVLRPIEDPRFARELLLAAPAGPGGPSAAVRQLAEVVRRSITALG